MNCLFDALETPRHLFFFHALTDTLYVQAALALAWLATARALARRRAASSGNPSSPV